jgi:hypothetical protein
MPQAPSAPAKPLLHFRQRAGGSARGRVVDPRIGGEQIVERLPVVVVDGEAITGEQVLDFQAIGHLLR